MQALAPTATSRRTASRPRSAARDLGNRPGYGRTPRIRHRTAQSERLAVRAAEHVLWAVINERDELGPDLVPDYLTSVKDGAFYGWPYSYYGQHVDPRVQPQRPDLVAKAIPPDYALSSHVAPLGMVFYTGTNLPAHYRGGAFVGEHGSWDRTDSEWLQGGVRAVPAMASPAAWRRMS